MRSGKSKAVYSSSFKLAILCSTLLACLLCSSLSAEANRGDDRYLSRFEAEYLRETSLLAKEARMRALEIGERPATDERAGQTAFNRAETLPDKLMRPKNTTKSAAAESHAGQSQAANTAGDIARDMACMAIDYASRFMKNFTTSDGNRWNRYRNEIMVPIALLLVLPGAVLTQVRAIMAQGNPVIGQASPLEGIQRGLIAIFLIPCSCLVTNYSIDLGNSLHHSVCTEYTRIVGGDMYQDAMCAEIRAFGTRYLSENEGSLTGPDPDLSPRGNEPFAGIEGRIWGKISDPCTGLLLVPANRDDAVMPQASIATRMGMYTANAGICAGWGMLTAFQMAFFYYLYFAGPIMAALWAWPTRLFQQSFPTWVESCVTLAFWSFLWQVTIALLAMTKSPASSGLYMVTALNVLATTSVKHAFDCASIMKSAVQSFEMIGSEVAQAAGSGGGGGGGKGGKGGKKGGSKKGNSTSPDAGSVTASDKVAGTPTPAATRPLVVTHDDEGNELPKVQAPKILRPSSERTTPASTPVRMAALPPAARVPAEPVAPVAPERATFSAPADPLNGTFFADPAQNPFRGATPETPEGTTCTLNTVTNVWNDPVCSAPPTAGRGTATMPRNTIGSVLGNSIQNVMHYPTNVPHKDPDLLYLDQVKAEIETQNLAQQAAEQQEVSVTKDLDPSSPTSTPEQESEMNSNEDPRIAALRDQRFNYPPPPMVSGQPAAGFTKIPTGAALTPQQLLSKLQTVAETATNYAPPPPPILSAPPLSGFSRVENNQQSFEPQEEVLVTVADYTQDLQGQSAPEARKPNLNHALGNVLRQRGAWAQAETSVKPPVPQTLSSGWWS